MPIFHPSMFCFPLLETRLFEWLSNNGKVSGSVKVVSITLNHNTFNNINWKNKNKHKTSSPHIALSSPHPCCVVKKALPTECLLLGWHLRPMAVLVSQETRRPYLQVQVALVSYVPSGSICHCNGVGSKVRKPLTGQVSKHDNPLYVCSATSPAANP